MAEDDRETTISRYIMPIERRVLPPDPYAGQRCVNVPGICMRWNCGRARWEHPEKGSLVLCEDHTEEVFRGDARSPPLRQNIDYVSVGRRALFLVEPLPVDDKDENDEHKR